MRSSSRNNLRTAENRAESECGVCRNFYTCIKGNQFEETQAASHFQEVFVFRLSRSVRNVTQVLRSTFVSRRAYGQSNREKHRMGIPAIASLIACTTLLTACGGLGGQLLGVAVLDPFMPKPTGNDCIDRPNEAYVLSLERCPIPGSICFPCRNWRFGFQHWCRGRYRRSLIPLSFQATTLPRIVGVPFDGYKRCKIGTPLTWV
jgi:hypothetical protein